MDDNKRLDPADGTDWSKATIVPPPAEEVSETEAAEDDDQIIDGDAMLNLLIHYAEQGVGTPITIYTAGMAIAGVLISRKAFLDTNIAFVRGKNKGLEIIFEGLSDHVTGPEDFGEEDPAPDYRFVHLGAAQIMTSGLPGIPSEGALMRFRRSEVVGWTIGKLQPG